jgi:Mg2+ and Co2+ transporter CorA
MKLTEMKKLALINYLKKNDYHETTLEDISEGYNESNFKAFEKEYIIYTEEEREQAVKEYIKGSIWSFNTDFILDYVGINYNDRIIKSLQKMQMELCEDANDLILAMINDFDKFVIDAINADGYGHFLSSYDGEENEERIINKEKNENIWFYIYRQN